MDLKRKVFEAGQKKKTSSDSRNLNSRQEPDISFCGWKVSFCSDKVTPILAFKILPDWDSAGNSGDLLNLLFGEKDWNPLEVSGGQGLSWSFTFNFTNLVITYDDIIMDSPGDPDLAASTLRGRSFYYWRNLAMSCDEWSWVTQFVEYQVDKEGLATLWSISANANTLHDSYAVIFLIIYIYYMYTYIRLAKQQETTTTGR